MALLYGHTGRVSAQNNGFRPGQWTPRWSSHPDPRWYAVNSTGGEVARWDAAMMLRDGGGGWLAYPTATVPGRVGCGLRRACSFLCLSASPFLFKWRVVWSDV